MMQEPATVCEEALPAHPATLAATLAAVRARPRTLAADVLWLLGSNILYAGCQWGTVVALARFAPAAALGQFGLALAIMTPLVLVTGFSLKAYQSTDVDGRYAFADYVNLRLGANLVTAAIVGLLVAVGVMNGATRLLIPVAVAKLADATSETCYGLAQRHDRIRFVALSRTTRGASGLGALAATVAIGGTVVEGAWALAATWTVFLLGVDLRMAGTLEPIVGRPDAGRLWRLARETAPLGGVAGVMAMTQSLPRYLLQLGQGAAAVGYYTALSAVVPALSQLAGALGNASASRLGRAVAGDGRSYRTLVLRLVGGSIVLSAVLGVTAAAAGPSFLRLAYGANYAAHQATFVLVVLAAGLGVVNTVAYFALVAARRLGLLLAVESLGLAVTGTVAAILVPRFGLLGAGWGAMLGAGAAAVAAAGALWSAGGRR